MTHPLTTVMCYDMTDEDSVPESMRNAADWQLERIKELWEELINSNKTDIQIIREFDKRLNAMRPQEDNQ